MPKIPQMKYTVYLFDFDYTLADSSRGIVTCFRSVLERHGYTGITDDMIKRTIGKTLEESFSILTELLTPTNWNHSDKSIPKRQIYT